MDIIDRQNDPVNVCRVGYALNAKKMRKSSFDTTNAVANGECSSSPPPRRSATAEWRGGGLADILEKNLDTDTIQFGFWDPDVPLLQQPVFDVIIHKLTEDIDRSESIPKMNALETYLRTHPKTRIVDPINNVRKVISRQRTCEHLQNIENQLGIDCPFRQPKYVIVDHNQDLTPVQILKLLASNEITFPIICKPVEACGTENSHCMAVIVCPEDLHLMIKLKSCVVQQYYNHDANFYKVYVINNDVMAFKRASLPNINVPINMHTSTLSMSKRSVVKANDVTTSLTTVEICEETLPLKKKNTGIFRSVEFNSRLPYPTLIKFLRAEDVVDNNNENGAMTSNAAVDSNGSCKTLSLPPTINTVIDLNSNRNSWKLNTPTATPTKLCRHKKSSSSSSSSSKSKKSRGGTSQSISEVTAEMIPTTPGEYSKGEYESKTNVTEHATSPVLCVTAEDMIIKRSSPQAVARQLTATNTSTDAAVRGVQDVDVNNCCTDIEATEHDIERHMSVFKTTAAAIRKEFGLSLFGFDVIIPTVEKCDHSSGVNSSESENSDGQDTPTRSQQIVVIDVNYFPSYKEVKDFPHRLKNYLKQIAAAEVNVEIDST